VLDVQTIATLARPVLAADPTVRAAFLFGSVARQRASGASDVDIAIVGAVVDPLALSAALSAAIKREIDVVELGLESPIPLLRAVLREGKRVYERAPGLAAAFASHARSVVDLDGPGYDRMMRAFLARVARQGVGA
jgi:uncharacterized protein